MYPLILTLTKFVLSIEENKKESRIGCVQADGKPTMWLDLSSGRDDYQQHVVVHEFGHALGLEHEHQRSDFWKKVKPFINLDLMKDNLQGRYKDYTEPAAPVQFTLTEYDPDSVMHYK